MTRRTHSPAKRAAEEARQVTATGVSENDKVIDYIYIYVYIIYIYIYIYVYMYIISTLD